MKISILNCSVLLSTFITKLSQLLVLNFQYYFSTSYIHVNIFVCLCSHVGLNYFNTDKYREYTRISLLIAIKLKSIIFIWQSHADRSTSSVLKKFQSPCFPPVARFDSNPILSMIISTHPEYSTGIFGMERMAEFSSLPAGQVWFCGQFYVLTSL